MEVYNISTDEEEDEETTDEEDIINKSNKQQLVLTFPLELETFYFDICL
jgi:hypothetical protein